MPWSVSLKRGSYALNEPGPFGNLPLNVSTAILSVPTWPSLPLAMEINSSLLFRGQSLLQELLDLIDVRLHIPVEGQEGRMGARREVVQVGWLSVERARFRGG